MDEEYQFEFTGYCVSRYHKQLHKFRIRDVNAYDVDGMTVYSTAKGNVLMSRDSFDKIYEVMEPHALLWILYA